MDKTDLTAEQKDLYLPPKKRFARVDVPRMTFVAVDGEGDPNTSEAYQHAVQALFAVSYAAKFLSKRELDRDYVVLPLEGLWSAVDRTAFERRAKSEWSWTTMIRQPDWLTTEMLDRARETAGAKGGPAVPRLRYETMTEGLCIQTRHIGSYDDEGPLLRVLHQEYLPTHALAPIGRHHEIYLNDPRRTAPDKLKTVLRQPVVAIEPVAG